MVAKIKEGQKMVSLGNITQDATDMC